MSALRETADPAEDRAVGLGARYRLISMMLAAKASDPMILAGHKVLLFHAGVKHMTF